MNTWMNNPTYLAQAAHFLGGACLLLATALFFGFTEGCPVALAVGIVAAAVKEFYYDLRYELPKQTVADSTLDFAFYLIGGGAGYGLAAWAHHLGRC